MSENKGLRFVEFIQALSSSDCISRAEIQERTKLKDSAFYNYLAAARQIFKIEYVGSIGDNAYYSIDKRSIEKYFNLK